MKIDFGDFDFIAELSNGILKLRVTLALGVVVVVVVGWLDYEDSTKSRLLSWGLGFGRSIRGGLCFIWSLVSSDRSGRGRNSVPGGHG